MTIKELFEKIYAAIDNCKNYYIDEYCFCDGEESMAYSNGYNSAICDVMEAIENVKIITEN